MNGFRLIFAMAAALALGACGKANTTCSDEAAKAALETAIRDGLQKIVLEREPRAATASWPLAAPRSAPPSPISSW